MNEQLAKPIVEIIAEVRSAIRRHGVRRGLEVLNTYSQHRFTAVFRFESSTLRNLHLVDRDDPKVERCPDQPVLESYCIYVRESAQKFVTDDSSHDVRVAGHPKQKLVQSYCGIPLFTPEGELFGTICHFDYEARPFSTEEVVVLEDVAADLLAAIEAAEWKPAVAARS